MQQNSNLIGRYIGAALLMTLVFGAPIAGGVLSLVASVRGEYSEFDFGLAVPCLALLAMLVYFVRKRFQPGRWVAAGTLAGLVFGMVAGFAVVSRFDLYATPLEGMGTPLVVVASMALFGLVAMGAKRLLTRPLVPELAGSPLEVPVPGRASKRATIFIGTGKLSVKMAGVRRRKGNDNAPGFEPSIPFTEITRVERVMLDGSESIVPPMEAMRGIPTATAGPGIRVTSGDVQWCLPTDDADVAIEIIRRRIAQVHQHVA